MPEPTSTERMLAAYNSGTLTESEITAVLTAQPIIRQAPLPDAEWYDAIIRRRGPVADLQAAPRDNLLAGPDHAGRGSAWRLLSPSRAIVINRRDRCWSPVICTTWKSEELR